MQCCAPAKTKLPDPAANADALRRAGAELFDDEQRRFARGESLDDKPMPGLDSEALDFRAASESFVPVRALACRDRDRRDRESSRLVTEQQVRGLVGEIGTGPQDPRRYFLAERGPA